MLKVVFNLSTFQLLNLPNFSLCAQSKQGKGWRFDAAPSILALTDGARWAKTNLQQFWVIRLLGESLNRRLLILSLLLAVYSVASLGYSFSTRSSAERAFADEAQLSHAQAEKMQRELVFYKEQGVPNGAAFFDALVRAGIDADDATGMSAAAERVFHLRGVRAGNRIAVGRSLDGNLHAVQYRMDTERALWITPEADAPGRFLAEVKSVPSTMETARIAGTIESSLFDAVADAGERADLAVALADIFGWDLDFHTDPRRGDTFRVAVEKKKYSGGEVRYARIVSAEYVNAGHAYRAVLFHDAAGKAAYYAPDGDSLQKAFLRSPLKFSAPVTSRFSRNRLHPVLKVHRAHLGVDYGAPYGAPVQSIGDGRVVFAGMKGGAGRMVHIRHANGYETMYLHLSRMLVRGGEHVGQGERIGLVGSSGLATGPHLDFRITQNGQYRNFEALRLPPSEPVARKYWSEFVATRDTALAQLPESGAASQPHVAQNFPAAAPQETASSAPARKPRHTSARSSRKRQHTAHLRAAAR